MQQYGSQTQYKKSIKTEKSKMSFMSYSQKVPFYPNHIWTELFCGRKVTFAEYTR